MGKIDVSSFFDSYLSTKLREYVDTVWLTQKKERITIKDLQEVFYEAMLEMFGAEDQGVQAYNELGKALSQMQLEERNDILNEIFYLYFGRSIQQLSQDFIEAGEGVSFKPEAVTITYGRGFQGNVLETVEQIALKEIAKALEAKGLKASSMGTGKSGAKADNVLTIGFKLTKEQEDLLSGRSLLTSSVREQNI